MTDKIDLIDVLLFECWFRSGELYKRPQSWEKFRADGRRFYDEQDVCEGHFCPE